MNFNSKKKYFYPNQPKQKPSPFFNHDIYKSKRNKSSQEISKQISSDHLSFVYKGKISKSRHAKDFPNQNCNEQMILKSKYLLELIEETIQYLCSESQHKEKHLESELREQIGDRIEEFMDISLKLSFFERNDLMLKLLSCLTHQKQCIFLDLISGEKIGNCCVFLNKMLQSIGEMNTNTRKSPHTTSRVSPCRKESSSISQRNEPLKRTAKLKSQQSRQKSQQSRHYQSLDKRSSFYSPHLDTFQIKSENATNRTKSGIKQLSQTLALYRVDRIFICFICEKKTQNKMQTFFRKYPSLLLHIKNVVHGLESIQISTQLQLLYNEQQFQEHLSNLRNIKDKIDEFEKIMQIPKKQIVHQGSSQIAILQKEIHQIMIKNMKQKESYRQICQQGDNLIFSNFNRKLSKRTISNHRKTNSVLSLSKNATNIKKKKKSKQKSYEQQKSSFNSLSLHQSTSKMKLNSLPPHNNISQDQTQYELKTSKSIQINQNSVTPPGYQISEVRKSLLLSQVSNVNKNKGGINNLRRESQALEQRSIHTKSSQLTQRRSGIRGLSRRKQPSTNRTSTRWNNIQDEKIINKVGESYSKDHQRNFQAKKSLKLQLPFNAKNEKTKALNNQDDSQSRNTSQPFNSKIIKINPNQNQIQSIRQTYNFLNYDRYFAPKSTGQHVNLTLSNKNILKIDQQIQSIQKKLFFTRMMTLLGSFPQIILYQDQRKMSQRKQIENHFESHNFRPIRKETNYEEKYKIQQQAQNYLQNTKTQFSHHNQMQNDKNNLEYINKKKFQKWGQKEKESYLSIERKLKKEMDQYFLQKEEKFRFKLENLIQQANRNQSNCQNLSKKAIHNGNEFEFQQFFIFLDGHENKEQLHKEGLKSNKSGKIQFVVFVVVGNKNQQQQQNTLEVGQKNSELSLKYQKQASSKGKFIKEKESQTNLIENEARISDQEVKRDKDLHENNENQSTQGILQNSENLNKKLSSMTKIQPNKDSLKIFQFPISINVRNLNTTDTTICKNIQLLVILTIDERTYDDEKTLEFNLSENYKRRKIEVNEKRLLNQKGEGFEEIQYDQKESQHNAQNEKMIQPCQFFYPPCGQEKDLEYGINVQNRSNSSQQDEESDCEIQDSFYTPKLTQTQSHQGSDSSQLTPDQIRKLKKMNKNPTMNFSNMNPPDNFYETINRTDKKLKILSESNNHHKKLKFNEQKEEQENQDFFYKYFQIQSYIHQLLSNCLRLQKKSVNTKISFIKEKNTSKRQLFLIGMNEDKMSIQKNIQIPKFSPTLKSILQSLSRDRQELGVQSKNSLNSQIQKQALNSEIVNLNLQIKVVLDASIQQISQQILIGQKYDNKRFIQIEFGFKDKSLQVLGNYEKLSLIKKTNSYFFLKTNLIFAKKITEESPQKSLEVILQEQTYSQDLHQLYQKEVFPLNQMWNLAAQFYSQKHQHSLNINNTLLFLGSSLKTTLNTSRLTDLKNLSQKYQQNVSTKKQKIQSTQCTAKYISHFNPYVKHFQKNHQKFINGPLSYQYGITKSHQEKYQQGQKDVYQIRVEEIPQSSSKTQYRNVHFVEYFLHKQTFINSSQIRRGYQQFFHNKNKASLIHNQQLRSNFAKNSISNPNKQKESTQKRNAHNSQQYCLLFSPQLEDSQLTPQKVYCKDFSSASYNLQRKGRKKRTTIELNNDLQKISPTSKNDFQNNVGTVTSNKLKKNLELLPNHLINCNEPIIKFSSSINDFNIQKTQKYIGQQTQKSLRSHSKSRLPRHTLHPFSLTSSDGKVLKSIKNIGFSLLDKNHKRRYFCPALKNSLNVFNSANITGVRSPKCFRPIDNFVDFKSKLLSSQINQQNHKKNKKTGTQLSNRIQKKLEIINKGRFQEAKTKRFITVIKRFKKYFICFVQWQVVSSLQYQMQVFAGLYEKNPNYLKIISGKIQNKIFRQITNSHKLFEEFINSQLNASFQINSNSIRNLRISQQTTFAHKAEGKNILNNQDLQEKCRSSLSLQKQIKTILIARFTKKIKDSHHNQFSSHKDSSFFAIVSIFVFAQLPNQQVYFHLYLPKNSKNFVFIVHGSYVYQYLKNAIDQKCKEKSILSGSKTSSTDKQTSQTLNFQKKIAQPRLSIFNRLNKLCQKDSDFEQIFLLYTQNNEKNISDKTLVSQEIVKSINTIRSIKKHRESVQSFEQRQLSQKKTKSINCLREKVQEDWGKLYEEIQNMKKRIKFNKLFMITYRDGKFQLQLSQKQNIQIEGREVICKKLHTVIKFQKPQKDRQEEFKVEPIAIELLELGYEDKKLSLLSCFHGESLNQISLKQTFIKNDQKLEHSYHFQYRLDKLLSRNQSSKTQNQSHPKLQQKSNKFNSFRRNAAIQSRILSNFDKKENEQELGKQKRLRRQNLDQQKLGNENPLLKKCLKKCKPGRFLTSQQQNAHQQMLVLPEDSFMTSKLHELTEERLSFTSKLLISMSRNERRDSSMKKQNITVNKQKPIFYSDIQFEFRQRCDYNSYRKVCQKKRRQKNIRMFVPDRKFCINQEDSNLLKQNLKLNIDDNSFREQNGYVKVNFKDMRRYPQSLSSKMEKSEKQVVNIGIESMFGQSICQLQLTKFEELFPFAKQFSNQQLQRFLRRILRDNNLVQYLRVKE